MARKPQTTKKTAPTTEQKPTTGNVFRPEFRVNMKTTTNKAGQIRIDNDDATARQLRDMKLEAVYTLAAKELGTGVNELKARYGHLNTGMQRMNLGNRIRGAKARKAKAATAKRA